MYPSNSWATFAVKEEEEGEEKKKLKLRADS